MGRLTILEPEIAVKRLNKGKVRNIKIIMDGCEWRSAQTWAKNAGFDTFEQYIENLLSLDIQNHAIEIVLNQEIQNYRSNNYPLSRVADKTGLNIGFVISKMSEQKRQNNMNVVLKYFILHQ